MREILVGTSGWSYDDWVGPFYPKTIERKRWLDHYADHFPTVEVNFTHYHQPSREDLAGIAQRMQRTHLRSVVYKAPRLVTHEAAPEGDERGVREGLDRFFNALEPAEQAGLLDGLLLQFSHQADPTVVLPTVATALDRGPPAALFVEVRHAGFNEDRHLDELRELVEPDGAVVATDSPSATITRALPNETAYFRFHGRNERTWFEKDPAGEHGSTRYDYSYPDDELEALAERVQAAQADRLHVFFNNHPEGKAAQDAQRFMALLGLASPKKRVTLDDF